LSAEPLALNRSGWIVGNSETDKLFGAKRWPSEEGLFTDTVWQ
jgi:hypothetical protein